MLGWYRRNRRDLPWRRTRDPWAIWVAEVMLQQTQVATVVPYYERFLRRFPDPAALAAADEDDVLGLWSGLGYYRRARALRQGAREVVRRHGGTLPGTAEALRELPGIGRYTAGAIASIAFGQPEPVLDGNVRRVLCRLLAFDAGDRSRSAEDASLWRVAETLVRGAAPGDLNQALMELGATTCTPRSPGCARCPLRRSCRAHATGDPERFPARRESAPGVAVSVAVAWIERAGRVLVERPATDGPLRGRFDLPAVEVKRGGAGAALERALSRRHGLDVGLGDAIARVTHGIMRRRLTLLVHRGRLKRGGVAGRPELRWIPLDDTLAEAPVSGATQKIARAVSPAPSAASGPAPGSATNGASKR